MKLSRILPLLVIVSMLVVPEMAFAAAEGKIDLAQVLKSGVVKGLIDLALMFYGGYLTLEYFLNFTPANAFSKAIQPAIVLFLAFKWDQVLGWIGVF